MYQNTTILQKEHNYGLIQYFLKVIIESNQKAQQFETNVNKNRLTISKFMTVLTGAQKFKSTLKYRLFCKPLFCHNTFWLFYLILHFNTCICTVYVHISFLYFGI